MLLESAHLIRRYPSVAAAVSVHALALLLLAFPDGRASTPHWVTEGLPPLRPPSPAPGASPRSTAGPAPPTPRADKIFTKPTPTELAPATTAEESVTDPLLAAEDQDSGAAGGETAAADSGAGEAGGSGDAVGEGDAGPGADGATEPGPAASQPIRLTSHVEPPRLIERVEPVYPFIARVNRVEGEVVLDCIIGVDGTVTVRGVHRSVALLDAAAVAAVERWRYEPARRDGHPQAVFLSVRVAFTLGS